MSLSIFQQVKPVPAGHQLVMAISKDSAKTMILFTFPIPGPYTGQTVTHTFEGTQPIAYYYQLFESPDGTATGTVRNFFTIQPNTNAFANRDNLHIYPGVSDFMAVGVSVYGVDDSLPGWNWYIERKKGGTMGPGIEYVKTKASLDTTIDDEDADGWRLLAAGDLATEDDEFIIHFYPQLVASTSSGQTGLLISATQLLTASVTLDFSAIGQSFWLQGAAGYFEVTLPDLATVPDNEPVYFMSAGGAHVNVGIKAFAGQLINFNRNQTAGSTASRIVLGQGERLALYRITTGTGDKIWGILWGGEGAVQVGEIVSSFSKIGLNYIFLDGTQGISGATYVRAYEFISGLDPACVVAPGDWNATQTIDGLVYNINHGKFSLDAVAKVFGLPKTFELGYLRALNGITGANPFNGFPGAFQPLMFPKHAHAGTAGLLPGAPNGKAAPPQNAGAPDMGLYKNPGNLDVDLTSAPMNVPAPGGTGALLTQVGGENRPSSYGIYMSMRV